MPTATATKHTCGGPHFGKLTPGCPRCDELRSGSAPRAWRSHSRGESVQSVQSFRREHAAHVASCPICSGRKAGVCTAFDW